MSELKPNVRLTAAICIELTPEEADALLLILNAYREQLPLPVDDDLYCELIRKLGTIHEARQNHA